MNGVNIQTDERPSCVLRSQIPRVFQPLLTPARYKGAYGGRGSGKSHFFAENLIRRCIEQPTRAVCIREVQKSISQSVKLLLEDKIESMGVGKYFRVLEKHIITPNDGIIGFQGMQDHTAESIKSLEGYDIAYCEEAQSLSERSLQLLRPTIRKPDSELWFAWNPRSQKDAIEKLLRGADRIKDAVVVEANWRDNPWFPDVLRDEMEMDKERDFDNFRHVWEGDYQFYADGAFYANEMKLLRKNNGVCRVPYDSSYPVQTFWDIGGARDQFSIIFYQYVNLQHRFIDYHESNGQGWNYYARLLNEKEYVYDKHYLPHDGKQRRVGLEVYTGMELAEQVGIRPIEVVPVTSSVYDDIRNFCKPMLPQCLFDENKCALLIDRLDAYMRKRDKINNMWLNEAQHDDASHGADAFRTFAVSKYNAPDTPKQSAIYTGYGDSFAFSDTAWMAG